MEAAFPAEGAEEAVAVGDERAPAGIQLMGQQPFVGASSACAPSRSVGERYGFAWVGAQSGCWRSTVFVSVFTATVGGALALWYPWHLGTAMHGVLVAGWGTLGLATLSASWWPALWPRGRIAERARRSDNTADFSRRIRAGIPGMGPAADLERTQ